MWSFLQEHEAFIRRALAEAHDDAAWKALAAFHARQLGYLQHERLAHRVVMLAVALLCLLACGFAVVVPSLAALALAGLLLVLVSAYILHDFRLENGVQRWYRLADTLEERCGGVVRPRGPQGPPTRD